MLDSRHSVPKTGIEGLLSSPFDTSGARSTGKLPAMQACARSVGHTTITHSISLRDEQHEDRSLVKRIAAWKVNGLKLRPFAGTRATLTMSTAALSCRARESLPLKGRLPRRSSCKRPWRNSALAAQTVLLDGLSALHQIGAGLDLVSSKDE